MDQWSEIVDSYPGWRLSEVMGLTPRERVNWLARALARRQRMSGD